MQQLVGERKKGIHFICAFTCRLFTTSSGAFGAAWKGSTVYGLFVKKLAAHTSASESYSEKLTSKRSGSFDQQVTVKLPVCECVFF